MDPYTTFENQPWTSKFIWEVIRKMIISHKTIIIIFLDNSGHLPIKEIYTDDLGDAEQVLDYTKFGL